MVGHTGSLPAAIQAVEIVDACVGMIADEVLACGGSLVITALALTPSYGANNLIDKEFLQ